MSTDGRYDTPPRNTASLEARLRNAASDQRLRNRLRQDVSFTAMAATLMRVRDEAGLPLFAIKGGVAMELRLGLTARATKDLDTTFRGHAQTMEPRLREAIAEPSTGFSFKLRGLEWIRDTGALRAEVKVAYRGRAWATVQMESSPGEGRAGLQVEWVTGFDVARLGLEAPSALPVVPIGYLIAQKLHACTDHSDPDRPNDRFRDLLDVQLAWSLVRNDEDRHAVRATCLEIFTLRGKHAWPPEIRVAPDWRAGYAKLADDLGVEIADVDEAAERVRRIVTEIDAGR